MLEEALVETEPHQSLLLLIALLVLLLKSIGHNKQAHVSIQLKLKVDSSVLVVLLDILEKIALPVDALLLIHAMMDLMETELAIARMVPLDNSVVLATQVSMEAIARLVHAN